MSIFTAIAAADALITAAEGARSTYATLMGENAGHYAQALYPKGLPSAKGGRLPKAVQAAWDDAKAAFVEAGVPDNDEAPRKAVSRLGMVALVIAANPKAEDESDAHFQARVLKARAVVHSGDSALIAAAVEGQKVEPKKRAPRTPVAPDAGTTPDAGTPDVPAVEPIPLAPIDALADALKAYVQASGALLDAFKACADAGVSVPKARRTLAESNARQVLAAMTA